MPIKVLAILVLSFILHGCGGWNYKVINESVKFEISSWNHDPIIKNVENADFSTFISLGNGYGSDKKSVFYKGDEVYKANPKSFHILGNGYSKDSRHVFLWDHPIKSADPNTFVILEGLWSKDNNHVFNAYEKVNADSASFKYLKNSWAVDKDNAYHALSWYPSLTEPAVIVFKNIDTETFRVIDGFNAKDRNRKYDALKTPNK